MARAQLSTIPAEDGIVLSEQFKKIKGIIAYERLEKENRTNVAIYVIGGPPGCGKTTFARKVLVPAFRKSLVVGLTPEVDEERAMGTWRYGPDPDNAGAVSLHFVPSPLIDFVAGGEETDRKLLVLDEGHLPKRAVSFYDSLRTIVDGVVFNAMELKAVPVAGELTLVILMNEPEDRHAIFAWPFIDRLSDSFWVDQPELPSMIRIAGSFAAQSSCPATLKDSAFVERAVTALVCAGANTFGIPVSIRSFQKFWQSIETESVVNGGLHTDREILVEALRSTFGAPRRHYFPEAKKKDADYDQFCQQLLE
jgi:hypothetical protein